MSVSYIAAIVLVMGVKMLELLCKKDARSA